MVIPNCGRFHAPIVGVSRIHIPASWATPWGPVRQSEAAAVLSSKEAAEAAEESGQATKVRYICDIFFT